MLGQHIFADLYGVSEDLLRNNEEIYNIAREAIDLSDATYIGHEFDPKGSSGIILIAESHLSWHAWPEQKVIFLDYFTCGNKTTPKRAVDFIIFRLSPQFVDRKNETRGKFITDKPVSFDARIPPQPLVCFDGA